MKKLPLLIFSLLLICQISLAQSADYATAGTGAMRNYISWFNWSGTSVANGTVKNFTTPDGLNVTVTFSGVTGATVTPYVMNTWSGAVLWKLYDFTNPAVRPALFSQNTISAAGFTMNIAVTRNGLPVPFTFVAADAEASDNTETATLTTSGTAWKTIEFFRNSSQTNNPLTGCGTTTVAISNTYGGAPATGQNPILATEETGSLNVTATMSRTTNGGMALAFGIFAPIDRGDLPASYGYAQHALNFVTQNSCNFNPPFPSISLANPVYLGNQPGDADGAQTTNDNLSGMDEDAVSAFPAYTNSGTYTITMPIRTNSSGAGVVYGWFDFSRNGSFELNERTIAVINNTGTLATLTWTGLPTLLPAGTVSEFAFRFRMAEDATDISTPAGYAKNGEVEDYLVPELTIVPCGTPPVFDFGFDQNICATKFVSFNTNATGMISYEWAFGDGQTNTSSLNPTHTYPNYGGFAVSLKLEYSSGCFTTLSKVIPVVNNTDNSVIANADTAICAGNSLQLVTASGNLRACWTTSNGAAIPVNNVVRPTQTTTYYLNLEYTGSNLVSNPDFSAGNTGFTSDYINAQPNVTEGQYRVGNNPPSWNPGLSNCPDHTGSGGNMMMVNGSPTPNARIWSQTVTVTPNTNYAFSTWIQSLFPVNTANLKFSINSNVIGNNIMAGPVCNWNRFSTTWNSGNATSAVITIVNNNTIAAGNDFAIDDIFFGPMVIKSDSVKVTVNPLPAVTTRLDTTICAGDSVLLSSSTSGAVAYQWTPATSLTNPNIASPKASPAVTTRYILTVTSSQNCKAKDSVDITVNNRPQVSLGPDTGICRGDSLVLNAGYAASSYLWQDGSNGPGYVVKDTGIYHVTLILNGCTRSDTLHVGYHPNPLINVMGDTTVCDNTPFVISAQSDGNYNYSWQPATGLNNSGLLSPVATPGSLIKYFLTATNSFNCRAKDSVTITPKPSPVVDLGKDTTICPAQTLSLNAQNSGATYSWNNGGNTQSILVNAAGLYSVTVNKDGCSGRDTIAVSVKQKNFSLSPLAAAVCKDDTIRFTVSGGNVYTWYRNGSPLNLFDSFIVVTATGPAMYSVQVTESQCGLTDELFVPLVIKPAPVIVLTKSNDISCATPRAHLGVKGGISYKWTPSTAITNDAIADPWVNPSGNTWYRVTAKGITGCFTTDSILVKTGVPYNGNFYVPNAFTPNRDGKNDCLSVKFAGEASKLSFSVYTRWGDLVFRTTSLSQCWDGSYNGKDTPGGVYVYYLEAVSNCGAVTKKGIIALIR